MSKLQTEFLGISFPNPFLLGSGPPTTRGQMIKEAWGCPVIYLGPGPSAMTHVPEEYVSIESMRSAVKIYQAILAAYR